MALKPFQVDVIKGWTRISCVAFCALVVAELDVTDAQNAALLKPLEHVLDRAWLIPMHASCPNMVIHGSSYSHL